jgi:hypothetical protein
MKRERYIAFADNCLKLAEKIGEPSERLVLLQMAQTWHHLAAQADGIDDLVHAASEIGLIPERSKMN